MSLCEDHPVLMGLMLGLGIGNSILILILAVVVDGILHRAKTLRGTTDPKPHTPEQFTESPKKKG